MRGRIGAIAAACLLITACGSDDDANGDTSEASALPGERSDTGMVQDLSLIHI